MSHLYQAEIFIDRNAKKTNIRDRPSMFILLPGGWFNDIWHCAAATALCQSEEIHITGAYPVTIIGMKEKVKWTEDVCGDIVVSPDQSIIQGSQTYNYFHSTQIPCLLARINKFETKFVPVFGRNVVGGSGEYLNKIIILYREHYSDPNAVCSKMWFLTPESEEAANFSTFKTSEDIPKPDSLTKDELFPGDEVIPALSEEEISPPYEFDANDDILIGPGPMLHVWASTSITMQYLRDPEKCSDRIQYLQQFLGNISDVNSVWVRQARGLCDDLFKLALEAGINGKSGKKVVIFNYRIGNVNKHLDANTDLLKFIVDIATNKDFVVIPLIVNATVQEVDAVKGLGLPILELYKKGVGYDKRYTAAFWAIIANELQDSIVHGLIGARNGSMDIAALMGVNTCSFDEPIFGRQYKFEESYILEQGGQLLRLLSQNPIMSIVYMDTNSWFDNGQNYNSYGALERLAFEHWLHRNSSDPHIVPILSVMQVRSTNAGNKALDSTLLRMEHEVMKIRAITLRELLDNHR